VQPSHGSRQQRPGALAEYALAVEVEVEVAVL
jgi:hypothetical protein